MTAEVRAVVDATSLGDDDVLADVDFFHGAAMVADPYPVLARMRAYRPVLREPRYGVLVVTGYPEAAAVLGDTATFSSCNSVTGPIPGFPVPLGGDGVDDVDELIDRHRGELPFSDQLPSFDPPVHTAHRALTAKLITPKRLSENEQFMWRLAERSAEPYVDSGGGEFISAVAAPYSLLVIADLLGVPEGDHAALLADLTDASGIGGPKGSAMKRMPLQPLYERFGEYITARRRLPADDVLTEMAQATFPDDTVPEVIDVVRIAVNLFSAGQETTVRLLSSALMMLVSDDGLQARLRREADLLPMFLEEVLRFESPIRGDFRLARRTTTVGGFDVPAGTTLMVHNGAANRDPRIFDDPDAFVPDRANARRHLAFGRGIHSCIGAPLARAEARVLLRRLLDTTSWIGLDEDRHGPSDARRWAWVPTYILRGLVDLHLTCEPV